MYFSSSDLELHGRALRDDGCRLAFCEYGDREGQPAVLFHGLPSCRLQGRMHDEPAREAGIRLITFDRPGMGRSDYDPVRRIDDAARDFCAVLDQLGLEQAHVFGGSGGTPYALATALRAPERVRKVALFGCLAPLVTEEIAQHFGKDKRFLFNAVQTWPEPIIIPLATGVRSLFGPRYFFNRMKRRLPPADKAVLNTYESWRWLLEEPFVQGLEGARIDVRLLGRAWGFEEQLKELKPPERIIHGEADTVCPIIFSEYVKTLLPESAELVRYPGLGHYLRDWDAWHSILQWLTLPE